MTIATIEHREELKEYLSSLFEHYWGDLIHSETIAAINDGLPTDDDSINLRVLREIYGDKPQDPLVPQRRLLQRYRETGDIMYLHPYNGIAIRANRMNNGRKIFPIETYPEFRAILDRLGIESLTKPSSSF